MRFNEVCLLVENFRICAFASAMLQQGFQIGNGLVDTAHLSFKHAYTGAAVQLRPGMQHCLPYPSKQSPKCFHVPGYPSGFQATNRYTHTTISLSCNTGSS